MLEIDGRMGEGGGQVLRTSLALSLATGTPFRITHIRANRRKPGLRPQHLAGVLAARDVGSAEVTGAEVASDALTFEPGAVTGGTYRVDVGTAGSAVLVLQTVLPPLLLAPEPSRLTITGGTHNPMAPVYDFFERVYVPVLERMGPRVVATLVRHGFLPSGGGRIEVTIEPAERLEPIDLLERGRVDAVSARAVLSQLPLHIAERELGVVRERLGWRRRDTTVEVAEDAADPGNALLLELRCRHATALFSELGRIGTRAETVASRAVKQVSRWLAADVPVDEHLADQLLLPFALAGGGRFRSLPLSLHARTQIDLIPRFLDVAFEVEALRTGGVEVRVGADAGR